VERPALFMHKKQLVFVLLLLALLLLGRLGLHYQAYRTFVQQPFYFTHADVIAAYDKQNKNYTYQVLKLQSDEGWRFYTTTHIKQALFRKRLRLQLFPQSEITFWDWLGTFYVKSRIKEVLSVQKCRKNVWEERVASQHQDPLLQRFYNAIFFASPLMKPDREKMSRLGISHLVALSGFHLGILWSVLYGVLLLLYRPLQQRYFPYRYALRDIGFVSVLLIGVYVWFVDAPPSLVRAYAMMAAGWLLLVTAVELVSFSFLAVIVAGVLVLFPSLLVSLGFWFSVAGVFYIFLLLHYTRSWHRWWVMLLVVPFGIFVLMLPVVHMVFPQTARCQLLSPLLSLLFTPFYPLAILLHLIGQGSLLDEWLHRLFMLECQVRIVSVPLWAGAGYLLLSWGAVLSRRIFYVLFVVATGFAVWLYI